MLIFQGHTRPVLSVAYAPDSCTLASGGVDELVRLWDLAGGQTSQVLADAGGPIVSLAFSPNGGFLAVGTGSRVTLCDLATRQPTGVLRGERGGTYGVAFSPDSARAVLAGYLDPHLSLYELDDIHGGYEPLTGSSAGVLSVAWSSSGAWIVSGGGLPNLGELFVYDVQHPSHGGRSLGSNLQIPVPRSYGSPARVRTVFGAHTQAVYAVAISGDDTLIASGGKDRLVKLWALATGNLEATLTQHQATVVALSFPPDCCSLLSADESGLVCLWDVEVRRLRHSWNWNVGQLRSVVFSPNGQTAAAGGDRDVIVWDIDEMDR